jgi:DNA helicase-2/ATP-dependent DNA helicase PcrA
VGDPSQTIYSFAGADARYLRGFGEKFPGTTSVELVRNYRSTPEVVAAANSLIAGTSSAGVALRAQREGGPKLATTGFPDEVAEAAGAAQWLHVRHEEGVAWSECAILFRINAQSEVFEEALAARQVPYVVRGAARFFDRPEVKQAVTLLRGEARSSAPEGPAVESVRATLAGLGWTHEPPSGRGQTRDRWESWQALADQAADFDGDLAAFVDDLDRRASEQHAPTAGGVTLATLHAAKGLEWDAVCCVGLQDGTVPFSYAETPEAIEEERRLLYVGMTRARTHLSLSWASARQPGGRGSRRPSRFLAPILPADLVDGAGATAPKSKRRGVAHCRECGKALSSAKQKKLGRCADCPASYDEELFESLREWRRARAEDDGVPAYVVFTDATLQLLAEYRPTTESGLLAINGVGPQKVARYGEDLLGLLA